MKRLIYLLGMSLFMVHSLYSQEFKMTVKINTPNLENVDKSTFTSLENKLIEYINNTPWTDKEYKDFEKIKGNLTLTITKEEGPTTFRAELDIIASRPVYGSNYESILFNYRDRQVLFNYDPATSLRFNENTFTDNLSSIVAFYMYAILGLDGDSFSLYGGDQHYVTARSIVQRVPTSLQNDNQSGWSATGNSRNRAQFVEEVFNPTLRPIRKAMYNYSRLGLDDMHNKPTESREIMLAALHEMDDVNSKEPNAMLINIFFLSKALELNEIFAISNRSEKIEAFNLIRNMDAANSQKYDKLIR